MIAALITPGFDIPDSNPSLGEDNSRDHKMTANNKNSTSPRKGYLEGLGGSKGFSVMCLMTGLQLDQSTQLSPLVVKVIIVESQLNWTHMQTLV